MAMMPTEREPFDLRDALPFLEGGGWRGSVRNGLDELLGLKRVRRIFQAAAESPDEGFTAAIRGYGLDLAAENFAEVVPATGPVVVMANHPFGGADALSLGALCMARRPDSLLMANEMAAQIPRLGEVMLPLSILGGEGAARKNAGSLRRSLEHLKKGGLLAVFPSGEVANWKGNAVEEGPWSPHVASLALRSGAALVVVKFFGKTPYWFHLAGGIHPMVRTALLPRVLLDMGGQMVRCRAEMVEAEAVAGMSAEEAAAFLRKRALAIAE